VEVRWAVESCEQNMLLSCDMEMLRQCKNFALAGRRQPGKLV